VADLIERECGVKYHPTQAWRICGSWDGAASVRWDVRWNVLKTRSAAGSRSAGRRLKKGNSDILVGAYDR
jgi:hypothetical protein